ncbi:invasion protein [Desulfovibrio sp. OttesenSCG-928-A18]|nr:invasion protein [Desulfovibrio sp. OttesenSCG-928-A18]
MKAGTALCALLLLLAPFYGPAQAAEKELFCPCRAAGLSPDAPLYYLELMSARDADKDLELGNALAYAVPDSLPSGTGWLKAMNFTLDAARLTAGIHIAGTAQARLSAEEALERQDELERMTLRAVDPCRVDRAMALRPQDLSWQYRLNYSYSGLYTDNIILADLNHDGIMDFLYREDPVLQLVAYLIFAGCGDNYYTPVGVFIARYAGHGEDMETVPGNAAGPAWDEFRVIAPDLPDHRNPGHDDPLFNWANRRIGFDPALGIYREMLVEPLKGVD